MASRQGSHDAERSASRPAAPSLEEGATLPTRDPARYAQTDHFRRRLGQTGRYLTLPLVGHVIRDGQLRYNSTDGWRFAATLEGVRAVVVVGDTGTDSPVLVTAWTELADQTAALAGDRWSQLDVETIALRTELADDADRQIPGRIRPRTVTKPFQMGGHEIETAAGDAFVECVACGGRFRSKRGLEDRRCHGHSCQ